MNRIILAAVAVFGFAGIAAAQQAPVLNGNYSAAVIDAYEGAIFDGGSARADVDMTSTASVTNTSEDGVSADPARVTAEELYSRK